MENKICVYAICKNEIAFVDKWLDSMSESDYIVVLDTGSTDGTFEKLYNDTRVDIVIQKNYSNWRFDTARNDALALCPTDTTIFVSTDLDEIFESGWAEILRVNWNNSHVRGLYKYVWSHNESGDPERIFYYDKIHGKDWYWKAPVHEYLASDKYQDQTWINEHSLDLFDKITLHHYPDKTKSRASYLPLLGLRIQEDPNDYNGLFYYSHELYYRGYYEKSIAILDTILTDKKFDNKRTTLEKAACYLFMGDSYKALNKNSAAISAYHNAIAIDPTYREPYLELAQLYQDMKYFNMAIGTVEEALLKSVRHYNWLERDTSWAEQPYDILAVSSYYIGDYKESYLNASIASQFNPTDERLKNNIEFARRKL